MTNPILNFFGYCSEGNLEKIQEYVNFDSSFLNLISDSGITCAYYYALESKQWEACDLLISLGAEAYVPYSNEQDYHYYMYDIPNVPEDKLKYVQYLFNDLDHFPQGMCMSNYRYLMLFPNIYIYNCLTMQYESTLSDESDDESDDEYDWDFKPSKVIYFKDLDMSSRDKIHLDVNENFINNLKRMDPRIVKQVCEIFEDPPEEILNLVPVTIKAA